MSKKIFNKLVTDGTIEILNDKEYSYICEKCNKKVIRPISGLIRSCRPFYTLCKNCKTEDYCLSNYGVKSTNQLDSKKEKIENTNLDRYGVKFTSQSKEVQEKMKKSCLTKYGTEFVFQSEEVKSKIRNTNLKNHGFENPGQFIDHLEKSRNTSTLKYGESHYSKTSTYKESVKSTLQKKYGVSSPLQKRDFLEKQKNTCLQKYGKPNFSQTPNFAKYHKSLYRYNNLNFDSSWELYYYIFCEQKNIKITRVTEGLEYSVLNKKYYYFPDFLVEGKLVEIKGPQFLDENNNLICPYDKSELGKLKCEEKQKCMEKNKVQVLSKKELEPIIDIVNNICGKDYVKSFKVN